MAPFVPSIFEATSSLVPRAENVGLPAEQCELPDFAVISGAGTTDGGTEFCASKHGEGLLINSISAQADSKSVRGIQITFTDGHELSFGENWSTDGREATISWDPTADTITNVEIWDGGVNSNDDNAVSRLIIETSLGDLLDVGSNEADGVSNQVDLGRSGMLVGMSGRHGGSEKENGKGKGGCIDNLQFMFAKAPVKSKRIDDIKYTPDPDEINKLGTNEERGFEVKSYDTMVHLNDLETNTSIRFQVSQSETNSQSWTESVTNTFGLSLGFDVKASFGFKPLADTEVTRRTDMKWEISKESSNTKGEESTVGRNYWMEPTVKPGEAIRCSSWSFEAKQLDIQFEGEAVIELEPDGDGTKNEMRYPVSGEYKDVQFTEVQGKCEKIDPESVNSELANGGREAKSDEIEDITDDKGGDDKPEETTGGEEDLKDELDLPPDAEDALDGQGDLGGN